MLITCILKNKSASLDIKASDKLAVYEADILAGAKLALRDDENHKLLLEKLSKTKSVKEIKAIIKEIENKDKEIENSIEYVIFGETKKFDTYENVKKNGLTYYFNNMKDELIKILPDLKQAVEDGIVYAGDLFDRAVLYHKIANFTGIAISLIVLIAYSIFMYKTHKWVERDEYNEWEDRVFPVTIGSVLAFISFFLLIFFIDAIFQLYIVPEIYILQLLTSK